MEFFQCVKEGLVFEFSLGLESIAIGGLDQGLKLIPPKCSYFRTVLCGSGGVDFICYFLDDGSVFVDDGSVEINENCFGHGKGTPFLKCSTKHELSLFNL